ncbi:MAG: S-layer homology domain-containing protein [Bacillota bacterium]|nr:S-layer homology domain-containing protein [Bacillota bacterium]
MRIKLIVILLCIVLVSGSLVYAEEKHWATEELDSFKQEIFTIQSLLSDEAWEALQDTVFDETKLNQYIDLNNWGPLIKLVLNPDNGDNGQMLDSYVYRLGSDDKITRENAVGGLVKLLTINYISGSYSSEELKPSLVLTDLDQISEMQKVLVQMAYVEDILDSQTTDTFRPQDYLTNAEAISMLYRVINKYKTNILEDLSFNHWSQSAVKSYVLASKPQGKTLEQIQNLINQNLLDQPINIVTWDQLLLSTLKLHRGELLEGYTYGLADEGSIRRDKAVAGMMKLLHVVEFVEGRDATDKEILALKDGFSDSEAVFDESKLAIAYYEGLIGGYEDGSFRPHNMLTNAEALALLARIVDKYY